MQKSTEDFIVQESREEPDNLRVFQQKYLINISANTFIVMETAVEGDKERKYCEVKNGGRME